MDATVLVNELLWFFFIVLGLFFFGALLYTLSQKEKPPADVGPRLQRAEGNPLMQPGTGGWDDQAVFNPAAIDLDGKVRLLFRSLGGDGISRIGYAESTDGLRIDLRLPYPVFTVKDPRKLTEPKRYDRQYYQSGGGWGGAEDPRITRVDDRLYITFNVFDGWDFVRTAVTSISLEDFVNRRWQFDEPRYLSEAGKINKNWVVFPEKINGKFAILHSLTPEVQIDYVDNFDDLHYGKKKIVSRYGQKGPRKAWDSYVRSAGPPPLKTDKGWLILYHANELGDMSKYKLGALLLDPKNLTRVIARTRGPILEPQLWYENEWKPGIIYACGAVVRDDMLFVYYGGGDQSVNAATISLSHLLASMAPEDTNA